MSLLSPGEEQTPLGEKSIRQVGRCPELSHSSPDVAQAHPTRVADRSAHSLKALYIPDPMPSVPPKCCSSSWQQKGCERANKTGREELLVTGRGGEEGDPADPS